MNRQFSLLAYRNRLLLLLGVAALCSGLVACARMAGKPAEPVEPATPTVPPELAMDVEVSLRTMLLALTDPESLVAPPTALLPADTVAQAPPIEGCPPQSSGDTTDGDGDNFAEDETRTFDCVLFSFEGISFGGRGSLAIDDKDDTDAASGVMLQADAAYVLSVLDNPLFSVTTEVSLDVSASEGAADYDLVHRGSAGVADPFVQLALVGTYDAVLTGTFAGGTVGVQGGFTITTTNTDCETVDAALQEDCRQAVQESPGVSGELGVTTSELRYDVANCATTFTGGYFDVTDPAGNVLKSTYNGCGPATVTINGQPVPPPEPPS